MNNNIFKSKKNEMCAVLKEALSKGLPPLFKVHSELIKRADPDSFQLTYSVKEMAQSLGYSPSELQIILRDLSILNFIDYQIIDKKGSKMWKVKILVH